MKQNNAVNVCVVLCIVGWWFVSSEGKCGYAPGAFFQPPLPERNHGRQEAQPRILTKDPGKVSCLIAHAKSECRVQCMQFKLVSFFFTLHCFSDDSTSHV